MPDQHWPSILQELARQNTQKVKLAIADIDGIPRGKVVSFDKFKAVAENGFGFCDVVFGWDAADMAYDNSRFTGWHTGYPDAQAVPDPASFRQIPWEEGLPFFIAGFTDPNGQTLPICPRGLLNTIAQKAEDAGYMPLFSQEFEWFNFNNNINELYQTGFRNTMHMTNGMFGYSILRASQQSDFYHALFDQLTAFRVPVEGIHTETGPGVYEAAINYAEIQEAADRAFCFKMGVKEIASRHNLIASFMAKFSETLPGCSGHVHQSLWDKQKNRNLFYDANAPHGFSKLMEQYIAGQLYCLPYILPMLAPTINSYKRLVEGAWAPTTLTWGIDNRTTALRALPTGAGSTRLETRVVGADSNPYLAMAACLASGLYGIRHQLPLHIQATSGSGYTDTKNGLLPRNLWEATQAMKQSPVAAELFGETFVTHFCATREWEWRQFAKTVTDWELKRYLEII